MERESLPPVKGRRVRTSGNRAQTLQRVMWSWRASSQEA